MKNTLRCALVCLILAASSPALAASDAYFEVRTFQDYQFAPGVPNHTYWVDSTVGSDSLDHAYSHSMDDWFGTATSETVTRARDGQFHGEFRSRLSGAAQRGLWKAVISRQIVDVYVKGPSGSDYVLVVSATGRVEGGRYGGADGSLQSVNGKVLGEFRNTKIEFDAPLFETALHDSTLVLEGRTGAEIVHDGEVYSKAAGFTFSAHVRTTQTYCAIGCLTAAVGFEAESTGRVEISAFPCATTNAQGKVLACDAIATAAPTATPAQLQVGASPNPFNPRTVVSFVATEGEEAVVEVFDLRGQRVAEIYRGRPAAERHEVQWDARGVASGVYVLRLSQDGRTALAKVTVLK